ncbi:MAG TPA: hypothetical protein VHF23_03695 [Gaiellaceae bacterium]|nr:hypothetical protein [Gaiellaceae bacterium]
MRRLLWVLASTALALGAAAAAEAHVAAAARAAGGEPVELSRGRGYAVLGTHGAALGNVARGWVRVVDVPGGGGPSGWVRGCERRSGRLSGRLRCSGSGLRFYVHGGTWRIELGGRGINVSAVARGRLGLDRRGCTRCTYSIGGGARRVWPVALRFFSLRG